jgi:hypothetical protein
MDEASKDHTGRRDDLPERRRPLRPEDTPALHPVHALQRVVGNRAVSEILAGGEAVHPLIRSTMESRLGRDLSSVRIHRGPAAASSAEALDASAYTSGNDVVFGPGKYAPNTQGGRDLLAHELQHVLQHRRRPPTSSSPEISVPGDRWEVGAPSPAIGAAPSAGPAPIVLRQVDPRHARGHVGEQAMGAGSYRAENGWVFIDGPSGGGGHAVTQSGADGVAYNVRTGELHILDNKSLARRGNVGSATAIDPARNLVQNLTRMIRAVEGTSPDQNPYRQRILRRLRQTRARVRAGQPPPGQVRLIVTNAGGRSTGVTARLRRLGVEFVDIQRPAMRPGTPGAAAELRAGHPEAPRPGTRRPSLGRPPTTPTRGTESPANGQPAPTGAAPPTRPNNDFRTPGRPFYPQNPRTTGPTIGTGRRTRPSYRGAGLADVLPEAMSALQDLSIRHAVAGRMLSQWSTLETWRRDHPTDVILAVVALQEWEHPDPTGQVARGVLYVDFFHGPTLADAEAEEARALRPAPPRGWRLVGPFTATIEPSQSLADLRTKVESQQACFIATACMGSPDAVEVRVLRAYRDRVLADRRGGRAFIRLYYRTAPPVARLLVRRPGLRRVVRRVLVSPAASWAATRLTSAR